MKLCKIFFWKKKLKITNDFSALNSGFLIERVATVNVWKEITKMDYATLFICLICKLNSKTCFILSKTYSV